MLRLLVCVVFATAAAYPAKSYSELLDKWIRSPIRNSSGNDFHQKELEMRRRCNLYGGNNAFNNLRVALDTSGQLLESAVEQAYIEAKTGIDPNLGYYCRAAPIFKRKFQDLMKVRKNCIDPLNRNIISEANNVTNLAVDYICNNEAKFATFIENGGGECTIWIQDKLIICVSQYVGYNVFYLDEPMDGEIKEINSEEECRIVNLLESCVKDHFSKCRDTKVETFVEDILDAIITPSCRKHN